MNEFNKLLPLSSVLFIKILILRTHIFGSSSLLPVALFEFISIFLLVGFIALFNPFRSQIVYQVTNALVSTFLLSAAMYYDHFGRILDYHALLQASALIDIRSSIIELLSVKYFVFYMDIIIFTLFAPLKKFDLLPSRLHPQKKKYVAALMLLCFSISIFRIYTYPTKQNIMALSQDTGILNAQIYQISSVMPSKSTQPPIDELERQILELKQIKPVQWPKYFGVAKGLNLILVQMESTENFVVGLSINGQPITPNLNKLLEESLYFPRFYSQIGQGTTSDAEFASNTSIYPLASGAISKKFIGMPYPSLPRILQKEGYTSMTFHPNDITFWRRDNLYPSLGFEHVYDKSFYQDEDMVGRWGSSDEVLFKKGVPILSEYQNNRQLFYASFITLSNHHPYNLPENKKRLVLPAQLRGTFMENYLTSVHYQDYALGLFIADLKANDLWNQSLFVTFGDHFGISKTQETENQAIFPVLLGRPHDDIDRLNIPLFIHAPGLKPQIIPKIGGQVDLLPTICNLLGITLDNPKIFGQDILNHPQNLIGFRYYSPDGTFISPEILHLPGNNENLRLNDHTKVANSSLFLKEEQRIQSLLQLSDYYLQSLYKQGNEAISSSK